MEKDWKCFGKEYEWRVLGFVVKTCLNVNQKFDVLMEMCPYDDKFMPWIVIICLGMFGIGLDGFESLKMGFFRKTALMYRHIPLMHRYILKRF